MKEYHVTKNKTNIILTTNRLVSVQTVKENNKQYYALVINIPNMLLDILSQEDTYYITPITDNSYKITTQKTRIGRKFTENKNKSNTQTTLSTACPVIYYWKKIRTALDDTDYQEELVCNSSLSVDFILEIGVEPINQLCPELTVFVNADVDTLKKRYYELLGDVE